MSKLSAIDQTVKGCLLNYPTLFGERHKVLRQLFITYGNGYEWVETPDGYVLQTFEGRINQFMRYDDLDEDQKSLDEDIVKYSDTDAMDPLLGSRQLNIDRERFIRKQIEDNIDLFAKIDVTERLGAKYNYNTLEQFSLEYSKLVSPQTPWGKIEISHVRAMEEVIRDLLYTFNSVHSLHYDMPDRGRKLPEPSMYSRMPENHRKLYDRLQEVRKLLNEQSGQLKRDAEFQQMITKILNGEDVDD